MKLFTISQEQITSGISASVHFKKKGFWWKATGINPYIDPVQESDESGILQTCPVPVDISSTVVVDNIIDGVSKVTGAIAGNLYMLGDSGHFYNKDLSNDNAPTDLRSGTPITDPANSVVIYKPQGGTEYLYYWQKTQIGRWDLSGSHPTGWVDNQFTGLESTVYHPRHQFKDNIYYGNKDRIGMIYNSSGTATNNTNVLDFPSDYLTICLNDDGTYLVAGITKNTSSSILRSDTKVIFWDTFSPSWNKEWSIPDFGIIAIKKFGNGFLAICPRGLYYFDFYTKPRKLRRIFARFGATNATDIFNDSVLFGAKGSGIVASYGKLMPEAEANVYIEPFSGFTGGDVSFIDSTVRSGRIYVGNYNGDFYYIDTGTGGLTSIAPESVYIPLRDEYRINRLDFHLAEPLASTDACTVSLQRDEDTAAVQIREVSYANYPGWKTIPIDTSFVGDQVKFKFSFTGGNVKIKSIDVYGELNRQKGR